MLRLSTTFNLHLVAFRSLCTRAGYVAICLKSLARSPLSCCRNCRNQLELWHHLRDAARAMFEATFDKLANLARIRYSGSVAAHEVKRCCEQLEILLAELQPGFRLLTDISGLEVMDLESVPYIE